MKKKTVVALPDAVDRKIHRERDFKNVAPIAPMPIKVKPFQHQIKAYNMALQAMGVIK